MSADGKKPKINTQDPAKSTDVAQKDIRKPYLKPTLEKHSDTNLWAFGTLGG